MRAGKVLAGRYRLERKLGAGGMGDVWVARHLTLDTDVAVKLLTSRGLASEGLRARFEREAKATAQLKTPHVVHVFDYGVEDDLPFLVMELLDGSDFGALGRSRGAFSPDEVIDLIRQAALGLTAAHEAGIIHRDIKPGNLFLARIAGAKPLVKVLDFGIAKVSDVPSLTAVDLVLGSPSYMSPEQVMGKPLDAGTDIWSLAVVAFLMLAGELPFQAADVHEIGLQIIRGDRLRIGEVGRPLPPRLDDVFDRAFATEPTHRFRSAIELADHLAAAIAAPVAAAVPPRDADDDDASTRVATTRSGPSAHADFGAQATEANPGVAAARAPTRGAYDAIVAPTVAAAPHSQTEVGRPPGIRGTVRMTTDDVAQALAASRTAPVAEATLHGQDPKETTLGPIAKRADPRGGSRMAVAVTVGAIALGGAALVLVTATRSGTAPSAVAARSLGATRPSALPSPDSATPPASATPAATEAPAPQAATDVPSRVAPTGAVSSPRTPTSGPAATAASAASANPRRGPRPTPTATSDALPLGL